MLNEDRGYSVRDKQGNYSQNDFGPKIRARAEQQALKSTVVTEVKVTIATLRNRTLLLKAADATLFETGNVTHTTLNLMPGTPYTLPKITQCLIISCNHPIAINYYDANGNVIMVTTVQNQFTLNGSIQNQIALLGANVGGTNVQLVYG